MLLLADAVSQLQRLRLLRLRRNELSELPAELARCTTLRVLDVAHNKLTALPDELPALGELDDERASPTQLTRRFDDGPLRVA